MARNFFLLLMVWSIQFTGYSQWTCLNPVPTCEYLGKSYFVNQNTGYILGDNGTLVKTLDGGATWTVKDLGLTGDMNSIFFTDELSGVMVGYLGTILKTEDGGVTWQDVSTYDPTLNAVYFPSADIGYAVGIAGNIIKTTDGGDTWAHCTPLTVDLYSVWFTSETVGYVAGHSGQLYKTEDGGQTWASLYIPYQGIYAVTGVTFPTQNIGYICCLGSLLTSAIFKTTDGGASWNQVLDGLDSNLGGLFFPDTNTGYVNRYNWEYSHTYFKTSDGGTTWTEHEIILMDFLLVSFFCTPDLGYATGAYGRVFKTENGGETWVQKSSGVRNHILDICFTDNSNGYFITGNTVYKSTDGGLSWDSVFPGNTPPVNESLRQVFFPSQNTGYLTQVNDLWKTTDAGFTWTLLPRPNPYSPLGKMFFVNDSTGYMCTHNTYIIKTCDGGLSWVQQPLPYNYLAADIFFLNDTVGWAASSGGYFFKTVNGGDKWVKRNTWVGCDWAGIFFLDDDNGILHRSEGWDSYCIFRTTNDHDWDDITGPGMEYIQDVTFMDHDHGYAVGNCIWYTPDGGYTWSAEKNTYGISYIALELTDDVYAGGRYGALWKHPGLYPTGVPDQEYIPAIIQTTVFPNPSSSWATIRFTLAVDGSPELWITDGSGRTLLHSGYPKQTRGTHEISVNTGRLAPGIYYYRLQTAAEAGFGKLLVIK